MPPWRASRACTDRRRARWAAEFARFAARLAARSVGRGIGRGRSRALCLPASLFFVVYLARARRDHDYGQPQCCRVQRIQNLHRERSHSRRGDSALAAGDGRRRFVSGSGQLSSHAIIPDYLQHLKESFSGVRADHLHVVIDCGNGAASLVAKQALEQLGCRVTGLYDELDGTISEPPSGSHRRGKSAGFDRDREGTESGCRHRLRWGCRSHRCGGRARTDSVGRSLDDRLRAGHPRAAAGDYLYFRSEGFAMFV